MEEDTMTADEHAPNRKNKKSIRRSGGKKKKLSPQNGEITDGKNQFEQPDRSLGGNTRSHGMDYSQRTNSDQFTIIGINGNHELNREVNQFPGSSQLLHLQYQHLGLHHQLIMGKYDAEIGNLTLEVQTLRDRMRKNSRKMKNLKAKMPSIETIPVPLEPQQTSQPQREPAKQLKKKTNRGSGSKPNCKKTPTRITDAPTQYPVCTFKLKRNFRKYQTKTKHGLEDNVISDILSASPANAAQSNVSPEQRDSSNTVFAGISPAQTSSNSHKNVDPTVNSSTPITKSGIFPKKLSESFQDISPNKMKRESEMVSLLSEHEDVPGIKIKQGKNSCPSCLSSFDDEGLLTEHIESSCPKNLCCQFCKKRFIRMKSLNRHLKTHERPTDLYKCPTCKKSFAKEKLLENHFRNHPVCIECTHSFKTGDLLVRHIKGFHAHLQARVCRYCFKMINRNEWNQHRQNCELQTVICFYCNKSFITLPSLESHIESKHGGVQSGYHHYLVPLWNVNTLDGRAVSCHEFLR